MSSKTVLFILALLVAWIIIISGLLMQDKDSLKDKTSPLKSFNAKMPGMKNDQNNMWMEENFGASKDNFTPNDALSMSKRMAVQAMLKTMFTAQMVHMAEYGEFAYDIDDLPVPANLSEYEFNANVGAEFFIIQATGNIDNDPHLDILLIDEEGQIYFVEDDLKNESYSYPF